LVEMGVSVSRPIAFAGQRHGPINSCEMKLFFRMIHKSTSMGTCGIFVYLFIKFK
jgi:hypothetical protein